MMMTITKHPPLVEDLRNHSQEQVAELRAVSRRLRSKAEPEGQVRGESPESDRKTAGGSVEAKAKTRSEGGRKVDRKRELEIDRKVQPGGWYPTQVGD